jgi:glutamate dehydrogenase/leucine dehydrogenase
MALLEKMVNNWNIVKEKAEREKISFRLAAYAIALAKIVKAEQWRGHMPKDK